MGVFSALSFHHQNFKKDCTLQWWNYVLNFVLDNKKSIKPCAKDNIELTFCSKIIKNEEMTKQFIAVVHEDMCISKIKKNIILRLEKTKK